ncbi:haloalkane dehalogenase [Blastococcus sp. CCUG 61487]|uniref:haloalkane dehalogenase n=1 Tax=Blastococcus sp. CCUG 61487 TaxID=1840703 RepID=UPI0010C0D528|nr:haloalkane dehalogenase [Blastococcus sp. CCUG 61487]TKJ33925.1 haloalkane dehalogenase [Blastococcus sp. CCUG 61487]
METVRTPDDRCAGLPDFPFAPHYADIDDGDGGTLRVHHLDEGPADAAPVLLMHGEPSWCYLYRHMIPALVDAGHRVVAPDLVGFGRSDKPTEQSDYTYARHVEWMRRLLFDTLDLRDITFFGQDWGGLVGLRLVAAEPDRFARVAIGNTGLPTGHGTPTEAFLAWQRFARTTEVFPVGNIVDGGCTTDLPADVVAAYDAPFPDDSYKAGARIFPALVPTSRTDPAGADNEAAWRVLEQFDRPFLLTFSDSDPVTRGGDAPFRAKVPGAAGQPHVTIEGAGHFLQEDRGPELARVLVDFIAKTT